MVYPILICLMGFRHLKTWKNILIYFHDNNRGDTSINVYFKGTPATGCPLFVVMPL
ncbi:hypothetical protein CBFG_03342 [Clostridiales bacterium 1_7_47FAA]|nr:hypothetical protein CBFG_03342 [Clostridiales bacterium 1_7_47FAA]